MARPPSTPSTPSPRTRALRAQKRAINAWEATFTFVPSHRPKKNRELEPRLAKDRTWVMMHNLKPAIVSTRNGTVSVKNVSTPEWKQKMCCPKFSKKLLLELNKLWGCIIRGVSHDSFRRKQYGKHGRHSRLTAGAYWKSGKENIADVYVKKGGRQELMKKMKVGNYRPGYEYSCRNFANDLRNALGHQAAVMFKDLPGGGKYLHEISVLFHLDFELYMAARREKFKLDDVFHLEDFSRRRKKILNLFSLKMGVGSKSFSKYC